MTPLIIASAKGRTIIARILISLSADVNIADRSGATALFWAARFSRKEIAEMLLAAGANPNIADHVSPFNMWDFFTSADSSYSFSSLFRLDKRH